MDARPCQLPTCILSFSNVILFKLFIHELLLYSSCLVTPRSPSCLQCVSEACTISSLCYHHSVHLDMFCWLIAFNKWKWTCLYFQLLWWLDLKFHVCCWLRHKCYLPRAEPGIWGMQVNTLLLSLLQPLYLCLPGKRVWTESQLFGTFSCGPYWVRLFDVVTYEASRISCSLWSRSGFFGEPMYLNTKGLKCFSVFHASSPKK